MQKFHSKFRKVNLTKCSPGLGVADPKKFSYDLVQKKEKKTRFAKSTKIEACEFSCEVPTSQSEQIKLSLMSNKLRQPFGEQIPFCEPYWYQGFPSAYYR